MESATGCSIELIGGETDLELELPYPNNETILHVTNWVSMPFSRYVGCCFLFVYIDFHSPIT